MRHDRMVSRYAIPTGIPRVDGLLMGPPGFEVSQLLNFFLEIVGTLFFLSIITFSIFIFFLFF